MTAVAVLVAALLGGVLAAQTQPTFRVRTELVRVDVLVTRDGLPVTGLGADAFEVRDNGVRQHVSAVTAVGAVRLGLVLDTSGSMEGDRLGKVLEASRALLAQLNANDHFVVLAFGDQIAIVADSATPRPELASRFSLIRASGSTALVDAAFAGILQSDVAPGPKLLLLMTDGRNNMSWLRAQPVIEAARRHETVIYPVAVGLSPPRMRNPSVQRAPLNDGLELLRIMAHETGGRVVEAEWAADLGTVFNGILDEYRQRYILTFTPEGVGRGDGWHRLDVRLRQGKGTVRARSSYWAGQGR